MSDIVIPSGGGRALGANCDLAFTGTSEWIWGIVALAAALGVAGAVLLILTRRNRAAALTILAVAALALMTIGSPATPANAATDCTKATTSTPPPAVPPVITVQDVSVNEDTGVANVVITRVGADAHDIVLNLATQDGTATTADDDYDAVDAHYTIPASTRSTETITVPITINPDTTFEPDEQFTVTLTSVSGAIDPSSDLGATVTIVNDDTPPRTITVNDVSVNEDTGVANVVITRTGTASSDIVLHVATADGTATTAGDDYEAVNTDVTIPASSNPTETVTVPITINPDSVYEPNEQFGVNLTSVSGAIDPASDLNATVTIVNDDPLPVITVQNVTVNEDTGQANIVISRTGATSQDLTFQLVTQNGTAITGSGIGGNDYVGVNNIYTFTASNNPTETITVPITINPDSVYEPNEQFTVALTPVAGTGTISSGSILSATVTIVNDDAPPRLTISNVSVLEDTGVVTLTITRTGATSQDISFNLSTQDGTAENGGTGPGSNDYDPITNAHYTIPASNNPTESITVNVTINPDTFVEDDETFNVNLTSVTGTIASNSTLSGVVTIVNDDEDPV